MSKTLLSWVACCALTCGLTGCYKATFYQSANAIPGDRHEEWSDFFIFGLVGNERFDVRAFCGHDELAEVRTGSNLATTLVSALTIGVYTPHKVYVTCAARPGHVLTSSRSLELSIDGAGKPVRAEIETSHGRTIATRIDQTGPEAFRVRRDQGVSL